MANPRKFSEKIALHTQKQAEETAAFEAIMREVSAATGPTKPLSSVPKQHLHMPNPNLGAYRGGSLPNVNQIASNCNNSIDLQSALNSLEDIKQSSSTRQTIAERIQRERQTRQLQQAHRRGAAAAAGLGLDKRADCSPYSSVYLSPPPDSNWRRASSDSAIHASVTNTQQNLQCGLKVDMGMNNLQVDGGAWDEDKKLASRPKSCEVPPINIYPSPEVETNGVVNIPITGSTGSLPDLTNLHFPSPMATPIDSEELAAVANAAVSAVAGANQGYRPSSDNLSPSAGSQMSHQTLVSQSPPQHPHQAGQHQTSPICRRRHTYTTAPSPLSLHGNGIIGPQVPVPPGSAPSDPRFCHAQAQVTNLDAASSRLHYSPYPNIHPAINRTPPYTLHHSRPCSVSHNDAPCMSTKQIQPPHFDFPNFNNVQTLSPSSNYSGNTGVTDALHLYRNSQSPESQPSGGPHSPSSPLSSLSAYSPAGSPVSLNTTPTSAATTFVGVSTSNLTKLPNQMINVNNGCPATRVEPYYMPESQASQLQQQFQHFNMVTQINAVTQTVLTNGGCSSVQYSMSGTNSLPVSVTSHCLTSPLHTDQQQQMLASLTNSLSTSLNDLQNNPQLVDSKFFYPTATTSTTNLSTNQMYITSSPTTQLPPSSLTNVILTPEQSVLLNNGCMRSNSSQTSPNSSQPIFSPTLLQTSVAGYVEPGAQVKPPAMQPPVALQSPTVTSESIILQSPSASSTMLVDSLSTSSPQEMLTQMSVTAPPPPSQIPDIIFTGVDESFSRPDFTRELVSAMTGTCDSFDSDIFPSDETLKIGLDPLDLDGLQMLTDPNLVTDSATEEVFRMDRF